MIITISEIYCETARQDDTCIKVCKSFVFESSTTINCAELSACVCEVIGSQPVGFCVGVFKAIGTLLWRNSSQILN